MMGTPKINQNLQIKKKNQSFRSCGNLAVVPSADAGAMHGGQNTGQSRHE